VNAKGTYLLIRPVLLSSSLRWLNEVNLYFKTLLHQLYFK